MVYVAIGAQLAHRDDPRAVPTLTKALRHARWDDRVRSEIMFNLAGLYNKRGVGLANEGRLTKASRMLRQARKHDPIGMTGRIGAKDDKGKELIEAIGELHRSITRNIAALRDTRRRKVLSIPMRLGLSGAITGIALGWVAAMLAHWIGAPYGEAVMFGFLMAPAQTALVLLLLPLWFSVSTSAYGEAVGKLWRLGLNPAIASLIAITKLPLSCVALLLSRMYTMDTVEPRASFSKGVVSLGMRTVPVRWLAVASLWLAIGAANAASFAIWILLDVSATMLTVFLAGVAGIYAGFVLSLVLFPYEQEFRRVKRSSNTRLTDSAASQLARMLAGGATAPEEALKRLMELQQSGRVPESDPWEPGRTQKVLKTHGTFPECHLTYAFFGGIVGLSPWLLSSIWVHIQGLLVQSSGGPDMLRLLAAGALVGTVSSAVMQLYIGLMCKE
jgi:hypothetical protein